MFAIIPNTNKCSFSEKAMKTILHVDLNNFYASVECRDDPSLRGKPVAVCGDIELRHGIVLAKSEAAKKQGVKTGYTIADAKRACPDLIVVKPRMDRYLEFSKGAKRIYAEYTDQVESFGIDECWLDLGSYGYGKETADEIRQKLKDDLGLTASVGVSYNKIFAKLGSDYKKPDATTVITEENYKSVLWPLPVGDMLFVGRSAEKRLRMYGICTIGDLAAADERMLRSLLGKNGAMLGRFANGLDNSAVARIDDPPLIKSIGNSTTAPRDLVSDDDIKQTYMTLSDLVASRLRRHGLKCRSVQISVRNGDLTAYTRQKKLISPICTSDEIFGAATALYAVNRSAGPVRSLGVRASDLETEDGLQMTFLDDIRKLKKESREKAIDLLRKKYGICAVVRGINLIDPSLSGFFSEGKYEIEDFFGDCVKI